MDKFSLLMILDCRILTEHQSPVLALLGLKRHISGKRIPLLSLSALHPPQNPSSFTCALMQI